MKFYDVGISIAHGEIDNNAGVGINQKLPVLVPASNIGVRSVFTRGGKGIFPD